MSKQLSDIENPSEKDAQSAYLLKLTSSLKAQNEVLAKDNDALAKDAVALTQDLISVKKDLDYFKAKYDQIVEQIKIANARYYGAKTEKIRPYQLSLFNEVEADFSPDTSEPTYKEALPEKRKKKRTIDYSAFDTEIIEYILPEEDLTCDRCGTVLKSLELLLPIILPFEKPS